MFLTVICVYFVVVFLLLFTYGVVSGKYGSFPIEEQEGDNTLTIFVIFIWPITTPIVIIALVVFSVIWAGEWAGKRFFV